MLILLWSILWNPKRVINSTHNSYLSLLNLPFFLKTSIPLMIWLFLHIPKIIYTWDWSSTTKNWESSWKDIRCCYWPNRTLFFMTFDTDCKLIDSLGLWQIIKNEWIMSLSILLKSKTELIRGSITCNDQATFLYITYLFSTNFAQFLILSILV